MVWIKAFASGFLATLIFHQGLFALFWLGGKVPVPPFNLTPVPPFEVPAVVSLAFFGGLWGLVLWGIIGRLNRFGFWAGSLIAGALGPTAVAMLLVFPLKGLEVTAQTWVGGLVLNAFWGFGVALLMTLMTSRAARAGN